MELKNVPSSPNSSPGGRSSVTPNSPLPSRVSPLRMTWIGQQQHLRQQRGDEYRDDDGARRRQQRRPERRIELAPHQDRRDDNPRRAQRRVAELQRFAHLERLAILRVDHAQLVPQQANQRAEQRPRRHRRPISEVSFEATTTPDESTIAATTTLSL